MLVKLSHAPELTPVRCIAATQDILGEGPFWDAARGRLWWFDIKSRVLRGYDPMSQGVENFSLPFRASAGAARTDGRLLLASEVGLVAFDPATQQSEIVYAATLDEGFRSNDGKIDSLGRFWWSVMDDDGGRRPGAVYRTDADARTERVLEGVHIPNTLACSVDGRTLHVADSRAQTLYLHDVDDDGALTGRRVFAHTRGEDGTPDGSAVDAEGYLWNAQWGAWRVVRYTPDGEIDRILTVPVEQPTCCAFGGEDLATLFITSAREGIADDALAAQPLAGALFACEPGVTGLPLPPFSG